MLSIKRVVCEVEERLVLVSKKVPELRQAVLSLQHTLVMGLSSFSLLRQPALGGLFRELEPRKSAWSEAKTNSLPFGRRMISSDTGAGAVVKVLEVSVLCPELGMKAACQSSCVQGRHLELRKMPRQPVLPPLGAMSMALDYCLCS